MVLGKFLPPHLGHVYLCEFAQSWVDELTIVVGTLADEPIPGRLRFGWMRELFPSANVVHLAEELPQHPDEHPRFWKVWKEALQRVLPGGVRARLDCVFASEEYGQPLAELFGAEFVPVDVGRSIVPVSGTAIRSDPLTHWQYLPRCVRPYFAKRVCVFGPESTGKSTLAAALAERFGTVWVPEYARVLLERQGGQVGSDDMPRIVRGQIASEEALARNANRLLFCDTDALTTTLWCEVLFGSCPGWMTDEAERRSYDLYLLTDVDVPWVQDGVRYLPDERRSFFDRCEEALRSRGRPYVRISGNWDERFARAVAAVQGLLAGHGPR
jgi:NadR type nicotinamide-nucleotide adenylyltransferase